MTVVAASDGLDASGFSSTLGKIAIIGGGKMGEAILAGIIRTSAFAAHDISVVNPGCERREYLTQTYGVVTYEDVCLLSHADTIILAIKPQIFREVALGVAANSAVVPQRVISVAAGVTTVLIQEIFPDAAVIRVMPNIALLVGAGMSLVAASVSTPLEEAELICDLFARMGEAVIISEDLIDAATALSGSGPAYFARLAAELARAGEKAGLPAPLAKQLSKATLRGTANYLEITQMCPDELIAAVASPGGTTQAALDSFTNDEFSRIIDAAVCAAITRAKELA